MQEWLISISTDHTVWVYVFIVFFALAEGPFLSMVFGVLIKLGYFDLIPIYIALMAGDLIGDTLWYYIGFYHGHSFIRKFGKFFHITEQGVEKVKAIFHKHKHPILFVSKITNGLGFSIVVLITAGMVKLPFRKYLLVNATGQFVWSGLLIGIGYFFSNMYIQINDLSGRIFIVIIFILILFAFMKYIQYIKNHPII